MINYIDYSYAKTKGETNKGDVFASSINMGKSDRLYTTDTVNNETGSIAVTVPDGGTNTQKEYDFYIAWTPVITSSLYLVVDGNALTVDTQGNVTGTGIDGGKFEPTTGKVHLEFTSAPQADVDYSASYRFNNEDVRSDGYDWDGTDVAPGQAGFTNVPEIQLKINTIPIEAKARTLRSFWAFDAAYELQKEYGQDIEQLLATQSTGKQYCPCM